MRAQCVSSFFSGGEGPRCKECVPARAVFVPPRPPPLPGRARNLPLRNRARCSGWLKCMRLKLTRNANLAGEADHSGRRRRPIRREATHMAYTACEAVVMAHMGTEATHMAYPACEAVSMAHMGTEVTHMA